MGKVLNSKKEARESVCVLGYNKFTGRVDRKDLLLHSYLMERKRHNKRCMKLFRRLLNSAVLNSRVIHWENTNKKMALSSLRVQLVEVIFFKYATPYGQFGHSRHSFDNLVPRLTDRHFVRRIPAVKTTPKGVCSLCQ